MQVIFLHGKLASGKLTIAQEVARCTGFALFHNHLTVDLLLAVFPFGSPGFVAQREKIWIDVMTTAVREKRPLIFTFNPENTVSPDFPANLQAAIENAGGTLHFIEVACPWETVEARISSASRHEHKKLTSVELFKTLKADGAFEYPPLHSEFSVDSSRVSPVEAATQIIAHLRLKEIDPS